MNEAPEKIITIGSSMGGLQYFQEVLKAISPDWQVAVMFVQHIHPDHKSQLPNIVSRLTDMEIVQVSRKHTIRKNCVYLPVPDKHMFVKDNMVYAVTAPKENGSRPSINTLFRSAAYAYREKVIGLLLSGLLTDGTLGMKAIQECGGVTIAQHPEEAEFPEMPLSSIKEGFADYSHEVSKIGVLLETLISEEATPFIGSPSELLISQVNAVSQFIEAPGEDTGKEDKAITLDTPHSDKYALMTILTLMQERTNMLCNLAKKETIKGRYTMAERYEKKAMESKELTNSLRNHIDAYNKDQKSA